MTKTPWAGLIDQEVEEILIGRQRLEIAWRDRVLRIVGAWQLLDARELRLEGGEGAELGRTTQLHRLLGDRPAAWRFQGGDEVVLYFASGLALVLRESSLSLSEVEGT